MASLVSTLFGNLKPASGRGILGGKKAGQLLLRGRSKRAYSFEVHRREAVASLWEIPAVYIYARTAPPGSSHAADRDSISSGLAIGYIGRTENMGWQDAEHERLGHFVGHGFDAVLILRVEQEMIRADIERDLIEHHNPVLNELLRSYQGAKTS